MRYKNIVIVGTSHIAKDSIQKVNDTIIQENPGIVAVELDFPRLQSLLSKEKPRFSFGMLRTMGITGFVFFSLGGFLQRQLGRSIGAVPGSEMKSAIEAARRSNARIALIDQPINITMAKISKIGLSEKLKLLWDLFRGLLGFGKDKDLEKIDISKVPDSKFIELAMGKIQKRYPGLYKALVEDRNEYMAKSLARISVFEPETVVVAVVGAGHEMEILNIIKNSKHPLTKI
jgi:pheromone shutdown protein TraB